MAATNIISVGQFFLLNNSLKCLNVLKKDYSKKNVINFGLIPPKPKKPISSYLTFHVEKRKEIVANNPGLSFKEISQTVSAEWKSLSESEKNKYREIFLQKYDLYKRQLLEYIKNYGEAVEENKKLNNLVTSSKAEKRELKKRQLYNKKPQFPKSSYVLFIQETIKKLGSTELQGTEKLKKSAELWRKMSEADKNNFKKIYQERYEQYEKDLSIWEKDMIQAGKEHLVRPNTTRKKIL